MIDIVVAVDRHWGMGRGDSPHMPWKIPADLDRFRSITTKDEVGSGRTNVVIMGRITADGFRRPLPNRTNVVVTGRKGYRSEEGFHSFDTLVGALAFSLGRSGGGGRVFVIGGPKLLDGCLLHHGNSIGTVHLTKVDHDYGCDVRSTRLREFVDEHCKLSDRFEEEASDSAKLPVKCTYSRYDHVSGRSPEQDYLDVMGSLLLAPPRSTRNSVTRTLFGRTLEFPLTRFPILTTKSVFWKGVVNELLFFLSGNTDTSWLQDRGVNIWKANTSAEFLATLGLPYEEGYMGPMYGYQWRHYGLPYDVRSRTGPSESNNGPGNGGHDQLAEVVHLLRNDPHSRRIVMTTYNPVQAREGVLHPCHGLVVQFFVDGERRIDCQMYQRSADWFLGVPFNIASYALLVHILVNHLNHINREGGSGIQYRAGRLIMQFGDHHLYEQHVIPAITQIGRRPGEFPLLEIPDDIRSIDPAYLLSLTPDNFRLRDYQPQGPIKAELVA